MMEELCLYLYDDPDLERTYLLVFMRMKAE